MCFFYDAAPLFAVSTCVIVRDRCNVLTFGVLDPCLPGTDLSVVSQRYIDHSRPSVFFAIQCECAATFCLWSIIKFD